MEKIDLKDKKILYEMSSNAREPLSKIAKKVGVSKEVCNYRVNRMIQSGIIKKFITLINTESLGYTRYELFIELKNTNKDEEKEVAIYLEKHPNFMWVRGSLGEWDICSEFYAKDKFELEKIENEVRNKFFSKIKNLSVATVIKEYSFPLKCIGYKSEENAVEQATIVKLPLDELDYKILKFLSTDARINAVEIASKLKISPDTVVYRIKNLLQKKAILSYRVVINESLVELKKYKLLLKLTNINNLAYAKLLEYLKSQRSTQYIKKCIGDWDFSVTLIAHSNVELKEIVSEIRSNLKEALEGYKILILFDEYKNTYFPECVEFKG